MRTRRFMTWLVLGIAVTLAYVVRRGRRAPWRRAAPPTWETVLPAVPDEGGVSAAPAELDLERLASSLDEVGGMHVEELDDDAERAEVYVVSAADRDLADDDLAQGEGENWLERLEASAAELGPEPEQELDIIDDPDLHAGHHKTDTRDTPVADRGSAGPRGL